MKKWNVKLIINLIVIFLYIINIIIIARLVNYINENCVTKSQYTNVQIKAFTLEEQINDLKAQCAEYEENEKKLQITIDKLSNNVDSMKSDIESIEKSQIEFINTQLECITKISELSENVNASRGTVRRSASSSSSISNTSVKLSTEISGLNENQFNNLIHHICDYRGIDYETSALYNAGSDLEYVECEYGINGIYILIIYTIESSFGENMCRPYNAGGLTDGSNYISFDSMSECIIYEGNLLRKYNDQYNLASFEEIASRYLEDTEAWIESAYKWYDLYINMV